MTPKQQKFADLIIGGSDASSAYISAGYKTSTPNATYANASRLLRNDKVASYIDEQRERSQEAVGISLESLTRRLMSIAAQAERAKDLTNARQALMDAAKLNGMIIDRAKVEQNTTHYVVSDRELTEDEWASTYSTNAIETTH